ncbi:MAG: hypothetical protein JWR07_1883 [Nevskia sp.]|nr:hypothetical protein [Nevskia sp.]
MLLTIPLNVGDRVRNTYARHWPNATVTELTAGGFKWRFDEPHSIGPRHGWFQEGEALTLDDWEPVPRGTPDPRKLQWDEEAAPNHPPAATIDNKEISMDEQYMCGVDFQHHLGNDAHGATLYGSIEDLRRARKCVDRCGIVAVRVELVEWVQEQDFSRRSAATSIRARNDALAERLRAKND